MESKIQKLGVGEPMKLDKKLLDHLEIAYAGMPNKETFSLAVREEILHWSMGYNLYFPITQEEITLKISNQKEHNLKVLSVKPEEIVLEYIK